MARRTKKRSPKAGVSRLEPHYDKDNQFCVYEIDRKAVKTIYHFRGSQAKQVNGLELHGFLGLPSGLFLNTSGFGFGKKGAFLLSMLRGSINSSKKFYLIIQHGTAPPKWKETSKSVRVFLPFSETRKLFRALSINNERHNDQLRELVASFLSSHLPHKIRVGPTDFDKYQPGELAQLLHRTNLKNLLNQEDFEALFKFLPEVLTADLRGKKGALKEYRIQLMKEARRATDQIYLADVIAEFERNLAKQKFAEEKWQVFLGNKVFPYLTSYVTTIDKEIINVEGKKPDFVLVDIYNFVDVFEIKRHTTKVLISDESRENFYWSSEISPAISQCENYVDELILNSKEYIEKIRRRSKRPDQGASAERLHHRWHKKAA